jgi:phosphatidylserine decarboxylase
MTIHKEGYASIAFVSIVFIVLNIILRYFLMDAAPWLCYLFSILSFAFVLFIISFFRIPNRTLTISNGQIISPADGKVVVIEETVDEEYFKGKRLQISVFMSPLNVHVNRNPMDGEVVYNKYHKGKFLVAWDPKSSTDNERQSTVLKNGNVEILVKQIAGAVARRIVNYLEVGNKVKQTDEYGFIKLGSRVDLLLPIGTKVNVQLNEAVRGGVTVLATL